jgi:hypothetical protein
MVMNVKYGKSLVDNASIVDEYQIPIIKQNYLRKSLLEYADRSMIQVSVKESDSNLALIQSLSPMKKNQSQIDRIESSMI